MRNLILLNILTFYLSITFGQDWKYYNEQYHKSKELIDAFINIDKVIELIPENEKDSLANAYYNRAKIYFAFKDLNKSFNDIENALSLKPSLIKIYLLRCDLYLYTNEYDRALADCNKALIINPNHVDALLKKGVILNIKGKLDEAIKILTKVYTIEPDKYFTHFYLSKIYSQKKLYNKALIEINKEIDINPTWEGGYYSRSIIYYMYLNKYNEALIDLNYSLKIKPKWLEALLARGEVYSLLEKYDEAFKDLNTIFNIYEDYAEAYFVRGQIYLMMFKYNEAIIDFSKAIKIDSLQNNSYSLRAFAFTHIKDYKNAISDYEKAMNAFPDNINTILNLAELLIITDDYNKALNVLKNKFILIKNDNQKALYLFLTIFAKAILNQDYSIDLKKINLIIKN